MRGRSRKKRGGRKKENQSTVMEIKTQKARREKWKEGGNKVKDKKRRNKEWREGKKEGTGKD